MSALTLDDIRKEDVRIACVRGKGIRFRCRKEERIYIQAVGVDDAEAKKNLLDKMRTEIICYREYKLNDLVDIFDGYINHWNGHSSLCQVMMPDIRPHEHNFIQVPLKEITHG